VKKDGCHRVERKEDGPWGSSKKMGRKGSHFPLDSKKILSQDKIVVSEENMKKNNRE